MSTISKNICNLSKADANLIPAPTTLLAQLADHY